MLVTIEAAERDMRYQGIVPLSGRSLSECLEEYFASSEQLPTRVRLAADGRRTVGLLVQKLPERDGEEPEQESAAAMAWRDAERGIESVQAAELVGASLQSLLAEPLRGAGSAGVQRLRRCSSPAGAVRLALPACCKSLGPTRCATCCGSRGRSK